MAGATPEVERPFRMWLYPMPALLAIAGFLYVMISRRNFIKEVRYGVVIIVVGIVVYLLRSYKRGEWPFGDAVAERSTAELE